MMTIIISIMQKVIQIKENGTLLQIQYINLYILEHVNLLV